MSKTIILFSFPREQNTCVLLLSLFCTKIQDYTRATTSAKQTVDDRLLTVAFPSSIVQPLDVSTGFRQAQPTSLTTTRAITPAHVGATRQGLTRALSGETLLLDITTDGIEESPLRMERLRQQTLKQPLHLPRGLSHLPPPPKSGDRQRLDVSAISDKVSAQRIKFCSSESAPNPDIVAC